MFERVSNGWQLTKQSFQVLRMEKGLVVFPLLSGIACLMVLAILAISPVSSALSAIVLAALYLYGATNRVPTAFDASLLRGAFAKK